VSQYFLQGAKQADLISPSGVVSRAKSGGEETYGDSSDQNQDEPGSDQTQRVSPTQPKVETSKDEFSISFSGPGLNSTVVVREPEDLLIVDAMLKKVSKALRNKEATSE
jgi:hypothetical protein